ncbi:MAG: BMP family ABC transporter substrate-binding protein [Succinivibrionaceae bacterium]
MSNSNKQETDNQKIMKNNKRVISDIVVTVFVCALFLFIICGGVYQIIDKVSLSGISGSNSGLLQNDEVQGKEKMNVLFVQSSSSDAYLEAAVHTIDFVESASRFSHINYKVVEGVGVNIELLENIVEGELKKGFNHVFLVGYPYTIDIINLFRKYPEVQFYFYGGTSISNNVINYHSKGYEVYYLQGLIAGLITTTGEIGFIADFKHTINTLNANAFALGVKKVNPSAFIYIAWSNSLDPQARKNIAIELSHAKNIDVFSGFGGSCSWCDISETAGIKYFSLLINETGRWKNADNYLGTYVYKPRNYYSKFLSSILNGGSNIQNVYWFGLESKVFENVISDKVNLTIDQRKVIEQAVNRMKNNNFFVFNGPIYSNTGTLVVPKDVVVSEIDLQRGLPWYAQNIIEFNQPLSLDGIPGTYEINLKIYDKVQAEEFVRKIKEKIKS